MNFTQRDLKLLLTMTLFLVLISFVFPAVGYSANDVNNSDIPSFNASAGTFDYINNSPEFPSNPTEGELTYIRGAEQYEDNRQVVLSGDFTDGYSIVLFDRGTQSNPEPAISLNKFNASGAFSETKTINESEFVTIDNFSHVVAFENLELTDNNNTITVDFEVIERPSDSGWISSIPIVGGIASGAEQLANVLAWIGSIIYVTVVNALTTVLNTFIALNNIMGFVLSFFFWLLSTYTTIVSNSPEAYISALLAIPGVILSFEFGKILLIIIRVILNGVPFT